MLYKKFTASWLTVTIIWVQNFELDVAWLLIIWVIHHHLGSKFWWCTMIAHYSPVFVVVQRAYNKIYGCWSLCKPVSKTFWDRYRYGNYRNCMKLLDLKYFKVSITRHYFQPVSKLFWTLINYWPLLAIISYYPSFSFTITPRSINLSSSQCINSCQPWPLIIPHYFHHVRSLQ